jgi:hypothetical protein
VKPEQLRAARKAQEELDRTVNAAHRSAIEAAIHGGHRDLVVKELIPTPADLVAQEREVRRLVQQSQRRARGPARTRKIDALIPAMAKLVYLERVMALDSLERAALTPRALMDLARVGKDDLTAKLAEMGPKAVAS